MLSQTRFGTRRIAHLTAQTHTRPYALARYYNVSINDAVAGLAAVIAVGSSV